MSTHKHNLIKINNKEGINNKHIKKDLWKKINISENNKEDKNNNISINKLKNNYMIHLQEKLWHIPIAKTLNKLIINKFHNYHISLNLNIKPTKDKKPIHISTNHVKGQTCLSYSPNKNLTSTEYIKDKADSEIHLKPADINKEKHPKPADIDKIKGCTIIKVDNLLNLPGIQKTQDKISRY
ncbi:MAG: hypothetical protein KDD45_04230 [Bdellovibrionales bacterium]|nr:hypothetical protein [Bdellovibrionales bacterium]